MYGRLSRERLVAFTISATCLLGGMWSPITLPRRLPQWWHPVLWQGRQQQRGGSALGFWAGRWAASTGVWGEGGWAWLQAKTN
jgi:hypothetical protein